MNKKSLINFYTITIILILIFLYYELFNCNENFQNIQSEESNRNPDYRNIEEETLKNNYYRKVLYTVKNKMQLVLMSLNPNETISEEIHPNISQFMRIESGRGIAIIDNKKYLLKDGITLIIPPGSKHFIKNTSKVDKLKLYTIYSSDHHPNKKINKRQPENHNH